jgi:hypothetical protein
VPPSPLPELPAAPPAPSAPSVTTLTSPAGSPSVAPATASGAVVTPEREAAPSSEPTRARSGESTPASGAEATRTRRHPRAATIRFELGRATRVVVVLRGPLPACDEVARFAVRGTKGDNELVFRGRIRDRRLAPGAYLLGLRPEQGRRRWVAVRVQQRGAAPLPRAVVSRSLSRCSELARGTATFASSAGPVDGGPPPRPDRPASEPPAAPVPDLTPDEPPLADVLGFAEDAGGGALPAALAIALLLLLVGSVAGIVLFVIKFLRSPTV